jgi:rhodanese-related sulfurtransferase
MEQLIQYVTHHPLLAGAAALALVVVVAFESRFRTVTVAAISSQDLIRLMNQGALVLDIRRPDEYAAGHVNGAKQLPSDQILSAGETFKRFKEKPVVVYCDSGSLAAAAVRQLKEQGFTQAFTLRGGLTAWRAENLPVSKEPVAKGAITKGAAPKAVVAKDE